MSPASASTIARAASIAVSAAGASDHAGTAAGDRDQLVLGDRSDTHLDAMHRPTLPVPRALCHARRPPVRVEAVRAVVITEPGGPEVLEVQEVPDPVAGPGEVVLDVAATAINRADLLQRAGHYPPPKGASVYPGMECSGRIAVLGDGVTGWQVGDEVCALLSGGGYAEKVAVPQGQLMPRPSTVSLVDAAALPEVTCTVHSMAFTAGRLQPGESILVHGGTSGIGSMAIQLAHQYGARVYTTAGTDRQGRCLPRRSGPTSRSTTTTSTSTT